MNEFSYGVKENHFCIVRQKRWVYLNVVQAVEQRGFLHAKVVRYQGVEAIGQIQDLCLGYMGWNSLWYLFKKKDQMTLKLLTDYSQFNLLTVWEAPITNLLYFSQESVGALDLSFTQLTKRHLQEVDLKTNGHKKSFLDVKTNTALVFPLPLCIQAGRWRSAKIEVRNTGTPAKKLEVALRFPHLNRIATPPPARKLLVQTVVTELQLNTAKG